MTNLLVFGLTITVFKCPFCIIASLLILKCVWKEKDQIVNISRNFILSSSTPCRGVAEVRWSQQRPLECSLQPGPSGRRSPARVTSWWLWRHHSCQPQHYQSQSFSVQPPQSPIQCRLSPECELLGAFHIDIGLLRDSQLGQGQQPGSCTIVTLQLHLSVAIAWLWSVK